MFPVNKNPDKDQRKKKNPTGNKASSSRGGGGPESSGAGGGAASSSSRGQQRQERRRRHQQQEEQSRKKEEERGGGRPAGEDGGGEDDEEQQRWRTRLVVAEQQRRRQTEEQAATGAPPTALPSTTAGLFLPPAPTAQHYLDYYALAAGGVGGATDDATAVLLQQQRRQQELLLLQQQQQQNQQRSAFLGQPSFDALIRERQQQLQQQQRILAAGASAGGVPLSDWSESSQFLAATSGAAGGVGGIGGAAFFPGTGAAALTPGYFDALRALAGSNQQQAVTTAAASPRLRAAMLLQQQQQAMSLAGGGGAGPGGAQPPPLGSALDESIRLRRHQYNLIQTTNEQPVTAPSPAATLKLVRDSSGDVVENAQKQQQQIIHHPDATIRPDVRVRIGAAGQKYNGKSPLSDDDVVIVPNLFGNDRDYSNYDRLMKEVTDANNLSGDESAVASAAAAVAAGGSSIGDSESTKHAAAAAVSAVPAPTVPLKSAVSGSTVGSGTASSSALLMVRNPEKSRIILSILDTMCTYFDIDKDSVSYSAGYRMDPTVRSKFHHDRATLKGKRNITVAANFGETRELAFLHSSSSTHGSSDKEEAAAGSSNVRGLMELKRSVGGGGAGLVEGGGGVRLYLPHENNSVISYGRAVNANWKHGVNARPADGKYDDSSPGGGRGTFTVVLWGHARTTVEEDVLKAAVPIKTHAPPVKSKQGGQNPAKADGNEKKKQTDSSTEQFKRKRAGKDKSSAKRGKSLSKIAKDSQKTKKSKKTVPAGAVK